MSVRFLNGPESEGAIRELLSMPGRARIAVAYWGAEATERLALKDLAGRDVIVVCDLMRGGCNPAEIKRLREDLGEDCVLTRDGLHAKVWLTDKGAVVGSSNASANGLGFEGRETAGLIEANVLVSDRTTLDAIDRWFEKEVRCGARPITDRDLKQVHALWANRRAHRPVPRAASILQALEQNPAAFADRNLFVWIYEQEDISDRAEKALQKQQKERRNSQITCWEGETLPPGAHVIDFHFGNNKKAKFVGIYQVLKDMHFVRDERTEILLCTKVKAFRSLAIGDRKIWERAATRAMESNLSDEWLGEAEQFAPFLSAGQ